MDAAFHLSTASIGPGTVRIEAQGELDSASAQQLLEALTRAIAEQKDPKVTLDLTGVRFIDSAGIRGLIAVEQEASRQKVALSVVPPPEPVTRLLEIAGVAQRVNLVPEPDTPLRDSAFLERVELELPADQRAPRRARAALRESMDGVVDEGTLAALVLMTSELVTNAVVHASPREQTPAPGEVSLVGLRAVRFPGSVRVEVDDPGPGFDPSHAVVPDGEIPGPEEGGRGLFVVDRCATRWGARRSDTDRGRRFSVWFEVQVE